MLNPIWQMRTSEHYMTLYSQVGGNGGNGGNGLMVMSIGGNGCKRGNGWMQWA